MKIAFLYGNMKRGGAQRVISCLADYCVRMRDEVTILTLDEGSSEYELNPAVKLTGLKVTGDSANKLESLKRFLTVEKEMKRWLKKEKPDAVLAFSTRLTIQMLLARPFGGCCLIASERANPNFRETSAAGKMGNLLLPSVDGFIFQTERVSRLFPETLRKKGTVIHNGLFSPDIPENVTAFTQREHTSICAVGRLDNEQKAYDVMFKAFVLFHKKYQDSVLNIYGRGVDESSLRELISQLGMKESIFLQGNHPHVIEKIKDSGMFVMTSRYEGMPNALIEAMACGLPCVCTDCDFGPAELIRNGENGLLTPVDDVEAIAAAMGRIADDRDFAEKLSQGALDIRRTHGRDVICGQYRDYILSVIKCKGKTDE